MRQTHLWQRLSLIVLFCAAFGLRLIDLTQQNIWWDEARNIDVALRPFWQIPTAPELDIQPPLYYWLLHGWLRITGIQIGDEAQHIAFFARFLSVFAGVIGVALIFRLAKGCFPQVKNPSQFAIRHSQFAPDFAAFCATGIAAFSPFWLAESQESRMYTVGMMFLMAAASAGVSEWGVGIRTAQRPNRIFNLPFSISSFLFPIFSALALLTHYNALFILVAWYGWWGVWALLQTDRWQRFRRLLISGTILTLLVLPIAPIALRQIPGYENPNLIVPSVADYLRQNWTAYLGGYAFDPGFLLGYGDVWLACALFIAGLGVLFLLIQAGVKQEKTATQAIDGTRYGPIVFLLVWLLGGLTLYYIAVMDRGAFNVRYSSFVTPALYLLLGWSAAAWGRWWRPLGWLAAVMILVGLPAALDADLYDPRFFREDTAGVAQWLRSNTKPGDLVLVDQKYPFGFYYQRFAIDPQKNPSGKESVDARYLFVDVNTIDQRLNQWATNATRIFWLQWFESDTDPRHAVRFLLDKEGQHAGSQSFQGYTLSWWQMAPPTHFALAPDIKPIHIRFATTVEAIAVSAPTKIDRAYLESVKGIPVVIRWQRVTGGTADRPLKARVALYNSAGQRVAQADDRLLNDRHLPPASWSENDRPLNLYWIEVPQNLTDGDFNLQLLVYDIESLEPLTVLDDAGNPAGIEAVLNNLAQ